MEERSGAVALWHVSYFSIQWSLVQIQAGKKMSLVRFVLWLQLSLRQHNYSGQGY